MEFNLPQNVEYIISKMERAGFHAHIVGGSVRDFLLGKTPDDYDITTDATPEETKRVFASHRIVDTGIKHGTVSLILDGKPYEITTYRVDGEYKDSRHPESVSFTRNIREDLERRDFTVNAMAYSPCEGIVDPFGGREDLKKKTIRAVGTPEFRFAEDALRILRGIRFSAALGFEIEENTDRALREKIELLNYVSSERIYIELRKTFSASFAYNAINKYSDVLLQVIPSLDRIVLPDAKRFESSDYLTRLLSIFHLSSDSPEKSFAAACRHLRTDTHIRELGCNVLTCVGKFDLENEISLAHALRRLNVEATFELLRLEILLGKTDRKSIDVLTKLIESRVCYRISDLAVSGEDILSLGLSGREIGEMLSYLLDCVIDKKVDNVREKLMTLAENKAKQK